MVDSMMNDRPSAASSARTNARTKALEHGRGERELPDVRNTLRDATGSNIFKKGRKPSAEAEREARRLSTQRLEARIRWGIRLMFGDVATRDVPINGTMAALRERVYAAIWVIDQRKERPTTA